MEFLCLSASAKKNYGLLFYPWYMLSHFIWELFVKWFFWMSFSRFQTGYMLMNQNNSSNWKKQLSNATNKERTVIELKTKGAVMKTGFGSPLNKSQLKWNILQEGRWKSSKVCWGKVLSERPRIIYIKDFAARRIMGLN